MKRLKLLLSALAFLGLHSLQAEDLPVAVKVGDKAPGFTLTSSDKKEVSLSDYEGKPVVLMFSRAHW